MINYEKCLFFMHREIEVYKKFYNHANNVVFAYKIEFEEGTINKSTE